MARRADATSGPGAGAGIVVGRNRVAPDVRAHLPFAHAANRPGSSGRSRGSEETAEANLVGNSARGFRNAAAGPGISGFYALSPKRVGRAEFAPAANPLVGSGRSECG